MCGSHQSIKPRGHAAGTVLSLKEKEKEKEKKKREINVMTLERPNPTTEDKQMPTLNFRHTTIR